jgi:hypothetical protein
MMVTDHILAITRESAALSIECEHTMSTESLVTSLREAKDYTKSYQINHIELRETYLQGLAEAIVSKQYPHLDLPANKHLKPEQVAKEIKELIKREQRRKMYRKFGHCLQPDSFNLGGLS